MQRVHSILAGYVTRTELLAVVQQLAEVAQTQASMQLAVSQLSSICPELTSILASCKVRILRSSKHLCRCTHSPRHASMLIVCIPSSPAGCRGQQGHAQAGACSKPASAARGHCQPRA